MCSSSPALTTQKGDKAQIRTAAKRGRTVSRRLTNACKECCKQNKWPEIAARLVCPSQPSPGRQTWVMCEKNPHRKSNFEFTVTKLHPHQEPGGSEISTQPKLHHPGETPPSQKMHVHNTGRDRTDDKKGNSVSQNLSSIYLWFLTEKNRSWTHSHPIDPDQLGGSRERGISAFHGLFLVFRDFVCPYIKWEKKGKKSKV